MHNAFLTVFYIQPTNRHQLWYALWNWSMLIDEAQVSWDLINFVNKTMLAHQDFVDVFHNGAIAIGSSWSFTYVPLEIRNIPMQKWVSLAMVIATVCALQ